MPSSSYTQQGSAGASFQGLPLSAYGFAPIIGYTQTTPPGWTSAGGSMNNYLTPAYGQSPADMYLDLARGSVGGLQNWANNFNPAMFGTQGVTEANRLNRLAGQSEHMFDFNLPFARQALRQSFDPQRAYFRQNLADLEEQSRLGQSLRGVAMTPYGAGAEANAVGRFINDWRDRQINRMLTGSQAASTLEQPVLGARQLAGQLFSSSAQIRQNAAAQMLSAYGLQGTALNNATQAFLNLLNSLRIGQSSESSSSRHESSSGGQ